VLEIEPSGELLLKYDSALGLSKPVFARRLISGQTVIVDAGRAEILLFDEWMKIQARTSYWPPMARANTLAHEPAPDRGLLLHGNELLLIGANDYLQFSLPLFKTRWVEPLPYARPGRRLTRVVETKSAAPATAAPGGEHAYLGLLRRIRFLQDADRHTLEALVHFLKPMGFRNGEWVMRQGEPAVAMYFVLAGEIEILKESAGQANTVARIQAGDMFGEMALLVGGMRTSSARALRDCHLLQLDRNDFRQVMARFPVLAGKIRALAQERRAMSHSFQSSRKQEIMNRLKIQLALKKLKQLPFLQGADSHFYEILASQLQPVGFLPGKKVFARGESGEAMYFISRGQVEVLTHDDSAPVAVLDEGEIFGEMALILEQERSASVRTLAYCQFLSLDRNAFEQVAIQFPDFYQRLRLLALNRQESNQQAQQRHSSPETLAPELQPQIDLKQADGFSSSRIVYLLSTRQEKIFGLDHKGSLSWIYGHQSERKLFYPTRCNLTSESLLVADTGNDRVLEIELESQAILNEWGPEHHLLLQHPRSAVRAPHGGVIVADEGNQRLVWVGPEGEILWEYGPPHEILSPSYAEVTPQGTILFADSALHLVQEVDRHGKLLWGFGHMFLPGDGDDELCEPGYAHQLADGTILIADTGNHRVLKVKRDGTILQRYKGNADYPLQNPSHCEVLASGDLLVYSSEPESVLRFSPEGEPLWHCQLTVNS
ncbi:MAG: cyclic nucleotide-binding domain-containing protein, partial [Candidatus Sericytochromatia bacterium]